MLPFFLLCICLVASSLGLHRREKCTAGLQLCRKDGDQIPPQRPCIPSRLEKISLHPLSHQRCKALVCVRVSANLLSHGFDYWDGRILNRIQKLLWRASQPTPVVGLWIGPKKKKKKIQPRGHDIHTSLRMPSMSTRPSSSSHLSHIVDSQGEDSRRVLLLHRDGPPAALTSTASPPSPRHHFRQTCRF